MKHTRTISLVLIATLTSVSIAGCEVEKPTPDLTGKKIYSSTEECQSQGGKDCQKHFNAATLNHLLKSPRYTTEDECKKKGHEQCTDVTLNGVSVWLPRMVGFMDNERPVYLQSLGTTKTEVEVTDDEGNTWTEERKLTKDELKERNVVAGGIANQPDINYNYSSPIIIGGWYPTPLYYSYGFSPSRPVLADGMSHSYQSGTGPRPYSAPRIGSGASVGTRTPTVGGARVSGSRGATVVRGGFGGGGRGFSSGG